MTPALLYPILLENCQPDKPLSFGHRASNTGYGCIDDPCSTKQNEIGEGPKRPNSRSNLGGTHLQGRSQSIAPHFAHCLPCQDGSQIYEAWPHWQEEQSQNHGHHILVG